MVRWIAWGLILAATNGMSTLVSRARNTPSTGYHAFCAGMNHATWFIAQVILVNVAISIKDFSDPAFFSSWLFYTAVSTVGSVVFHYVSMKYFEKGNRRVGAYEERP